MEGRLPDGTTRLLLVRHGATDFSAEGGRCYGKRDVPLSAVGRSQACALADQLARAPLAAIYSSPLGRARDTAGPIADRHGLGVVVREELREIDFGVAEGLTWDEIRRLYPQLFADWMAQPTEVEFPGGESYRRLAARVLPAVASLRRVHAGRTLAVVTHAGCIRCVLADALGLPPANVFRLDIASASVSVVDFLGDAPLVRRLGD